MSLNVRRPDDVLLDFAPSPAVAKEAAHVVGALTAPDAPARGTAAELLFTRTVVLHGDNTAAAIAAKRQEILDSFHRTFSVYEKLFEVIARFVH
jgi:hypothetical protein